MLNFVNSVTSMIGALFGAAIVDRLGRRKLLLSSTSALVVILAIGRFSLIICAGLNQTYFFHVVSGLLSNPGDTTRANAGITFSTSSVLLSSTIRP